MNTEYTPLTRQRFERKFLIHPYSRSQAEMIIRFHPAVFSPIFKQRQVNNLYFDTPSLRFFYDNIYGSSDRKKFRIRWYGELFGKIQNPVLEIKIKNGYVGRKLSFPLITFDVDQELTGEDIIRVFAQSELPEWVQNELTILQPSLLNSYHRSYYQSHDRRFRITIDDQLQYFDVYTLPNKFERARSIHTEVVLELKYDFDQDDVADEITSELPFRLIKNSKYINGILLFKSQVAI
ncbi:MAG: polyphosphate polymerase domain-containing protein [Bacteroidales bacterium]|nr:polyphosphate polymerase domain-containing protein [Bacteroidales bacterium]